MERVWHFDADRDPRLADRIEMAIRARIERLVDFPHMGRAKPHLGIRKLSLTDIQYRIGYRVGDDDILVTSVRSTREAA